MLVLVLQGNAHSSSQLGDWHYRERHAPKERLMSSRYHCQERRCCKVRSEALHAMSDVCQKICQLSGADMACALQAAVLVVPFVDVVSTMSDPNLQATVMEYEV